MAPENSSEETKYQAEIRIRQWNKDDINAQGRIGSMCTADMKLLIFDQPTSQAMRSQVSISLSTISL